MTHRHSLGLRMARQLEVSLPPEKENSMSMSMGKAKLLNFNNGNRPV